MKAPIRNTSTHYGVVAQIFHWLVVVGILMQFVWAWRIDQTESVRQQFALIVEHKSIGMTVLILVLLRIAWRMFNRPPALPGGMSPVERRAAVVTHWLLYVLILAMPLSGWAWSSAAGYGAEFFGLVDIPGFVSQSEKWADRFETLHEALAVSILVLSGVHVAAALRHHFWLKDSTLRRMLPTWK